MKADAASPAYIMLLHFAVVLLAMDFWAVWRSLPAVIPDDGPEEPVVAEPVLLPPPFMRREVGRGVAGQLVSHTHFSQSGT